MSAMLLTKRPSKGLALSSTVVFPVFLLLIKSLVIVKEAKLQKYKPNGRMMGMTGRPALLTFKVETQSPFNAIACEVGRYLACLVDHKMSHFTVCIVLRHF